MLPSIFGENLFDDFFTDPFSMIPSGRDVLYGKHGKNLMKTDVRETDNSYELDVDLPGFKKDEINVEIADGYLTIQASKGLDKDQVHPPGALRRFLQPELLHRGRRPCRRHLRQVRGRHPASVGPQGRPEGTAQDLDHRDRINSIDRLYRRASARRLSSL